MIFKFSSQKVERASLCRKYAKSWFKRRILHALNQILILVDSNEYVRFIWFKRRIVLPNKIAGASDVF